MTAVPYFLLLMPLVDLIRNSPDGGDILLFAGLLYLSWRNRWL
jgi:hypothetical protein